jgi:hypothetical protein
VIFGRDRRDCWAPNPQDPPYGMRQVRMTSRGDRHGLAMTAGLLILLRLTSPRLPATVHGTTYEHNTRQRRHPLCDAGTRAVSRYNQRFDRWETTMSESPRHSCKTRMDPHTQPVEVRCR